MRSVIDAKAQPLNDAIAEAMIASLFEPKPAPLPGQVGLELEFFPISPGERPTPVSVQRSVEALSTDPGLIDEARISFEPGGQLELSPPPQPSVAAALERAWRLTERAERALAARAIQLSVGGVHPWASADEIGLQVERPRYIVMQRHFDAIGPAGRRMMRQTAALQVCLDLAGDEAVIERWRLANMAGPALVSAFANASLFEAGPAPSPLLRIRTWLEVDPTRTGFDGFQASPEPVTSYRDFVLGAQAMPLRRAADEDRSLPVHRTWASWIADRDGRPDVEDFSHHLSTLFPPVRPRGHLEIRYLDALPHELCAVAVSVLAALLYDRRARGEGLEITAANPETLASRWRTSGATGLGDGQLRDQAVALMDIAATAVTRFPPGYFPPRTQALIGAFARAYTEAGRCPADDRTHRLRSTTKGLPAWSS